MKSFATLPIFFTSWRDFEGALEQSEGLDARWESFCNGASVDESAEATPKSVMRVMSVKGLTLYHLKSHLQVRIFPCFEQIIARYSLAVRYEELVIGFM